MKDLKKEWSAYKSLQDRQILYLENARILSLYCIENGIAKFRVIDCYSMLDHPRKIQDFFLPAMKASNLTSEQLAMVQESGMALIYEKQLLLVNPTIFNSISDLFGIAKKAAEKSLWRDLILARLFREQYVATATFGLCGES